MGRKAGAGAGSTFSWRAAVALALLVAVAAGAIGHGDPMPEESPVGADGYPSAGALAAYKFIGRPGTTIEKAPCPPAPPGGPPEENGHIAHVYTMRTREGDTPGKDSVRSFHLQEFKDVDEFEEGLYDGTIMLGTHGFILLKLPKPVTDAPGRDFRVSDVHGPSSFCMWGSVDEGGPFFFIGNGFQTPIPGNPPAWDQVDLFELAADYVPLFKANRPGVPVVQYVLLQASRSTFEWLRADFDTDPASPFATDKVLVTFRDHSSRGSMEPDPIESWEWWWDTDPSEASTVDMTQPPDLGCNASCVPAPQSFPADSETTFCLRVSTLDDDGSPSDQDTMCRDLVVVDPALAGDLPSVVLTGRGEGPQRRMWTVAAFPDDNECIGAGVWWSLDGMPAFLGDTTWTGELPDMEPHQLTAYVKDCAGQQSPLFVLVMQGTLTPPVLGPLPEMTRVVGEYVTFEVSASDEDGDALTFTYGPAGLPAGARAEPLGDGVQEFRWLTDAAAPGLHLIDVEVSDGTSSVRGQAIIHLLAELRDSDGDGVHDGGDTCPGQANRAQGGCSRVEEAPSPASGTATGWESPAPERCVPPYPGAPDPCASAEPRGPVRPQAEDRPPAHPCSATSTDPEASEKCQAAVAKLRDPAAPAGDAASMWGAAAGAGFGFAAALLLVLALGPAVLVAKRRRR